ncbi:hypothetical protein BDF14DRAFT_1852857 [Spinellus fusiger]|nr:hypothetical protein BDF14DRAFT_1852857 [Spinellus fusiger]
MGKNRKAPRLYKDGIDGTNDLIFQLRSEICSKDEKIKEMIQNQVNVDAKIADLKRQIEHTQSEINKLKAPTSQLNSLSANMRGSSVEETSVSPPDEEPSRRVILRPRSYAFISDIKDLIRSSYQPPNNSEVDEETKEKIIHDRYRLLCKEANIIVDGMRRNQDNSGILKWGSVRVDLRQEAYTRLEEFAALHYVPFNKCKRSWAAYDMISGRWKTRRKSYYEKYMQNSNFTL